ncbi:MAG TPA: hypothetical protein DD670_12080 [Planctomycetaceae bacterium]|nr:hypothetical protein [Planctomycetaceae bacterium]
MNPNVPRSPNLNPYCESWVWRTRAEVLNHFIVFGEGHLRHILDRWHIHYHFQRPYQGLGQVPIGSDLPPAETLEEFCSDDVVCHESLGGLLKHFERPAAA